ncbi:hypothetical protein AC579_3641, partial [Pseudocercospora musae]
PVSHANTSKCTSLSRHKAADKEHDLQCLVIFQHTFRITPAAMPDQTTRCPCCDDLVPVAGVITFDGNTSCRACATNILLPRFHAALQYEDDWLQLRANNRRPKAADFVSLLGQEFVQRYERIEQEYLIGEARVYCTHMIVSETAPPRGGITDTSTTQLCYHCGGLLCGRCGRLHYSTEQANAHLNPSQCVLTQEQTADPLAGTGVSGQKCPTCKTFYAQGDGCNHAKCLRCSTDFCFACGQAATDDSGHWTMGTGTCPRWPPSEGPTRYDGSPTSFVGGVPLQRLMEAVEGRPLRMFMAANMFVSTFRDAMADRLQLSSENIHWLARIPEDVEFLADFSEDGLEAQFVGLAPFRQQSDVSAAHTSLLERQIRAYFDSPAVAGPQVSGERALMAFRDQAMANLPMPRVDMYGQFIDDELVEGADDGSEAGDEGAMVLFPSSGFISQRDAESRPWYLHLNIGRSFNAFSQVGVDTGSLEAEDLTVEIHITLDIDFATGSVLEARIEGFGEEVEDQAQHDRIHLICSQLNANGRSRLRRVLESMIRSGLVEVDEDMDLD